MTNELEQLEKLSAFLKRMNSKVLLFGLLEKAKQEYDSLNYQNGMKILLDAYKFDKNNPAILRGLGCYKQHKKDYKSAVKYFKKALSYSQTKEVEYTMLGIAYYLQGDLDNSVTNFNLAIDYNDDNTLAYEVRNQAMLERHIKIVDLQETLKKYF